MYIDVHCHLNDSAFDDVESVVEDMRRLGVGFALCAGCDMESSYKAKELAEKYPEIYFCAGFQPQEVNKYRDGDVEKLRALCRHEKCLAVGEIGLDYHWEDNPSKEWQKEVFSMQLRLADEEGLPVVIHSRDCAGDMQQFLTENTARLRHGYLLHCYSHSAEQSEAFVKTGGYFSFGGTATFDNSRKTVKSVARIPSDRILTETDSPYLAPEPRRGTFPNTPANVARVADYLAELRGETTEEFCAGVRRNAERLLGLRAKETLCKA